MSSDTAPQYELVPHDHLPSIAEGLSIVEHPCIDSEHLYLHTRMDSSFGDSHPSQAFRGS